jgi:hypothetical protein
MGDGSSSINLDTAHGRDWPSVRQFNVFLENRVGVMLSVVRKFEDTDIRIISLTVNDMADCAIVRMVLSDPDRARDVFQRSGMPTTETDLLVVGLPDGPHPLPRICKALLIAEINIDYAYPLLVGPQGQPALALRVDDHETAVHTLRRQGFTIFTEKDFDS